MDDKLYIKKEGEKGERPIIKMHLRSVKEKKNKNESNVSADYIKKEGELSSAIFVIISGGIKREKQYFTRIMDFKTFPRIDIKFITKDSDTGEEGLSPDKLYKEAKKIKEKFITDNTVDKDDSIYIVADVDEYMNVLLKIKPLCENENINLIISNTCFEVWLYYGKKKEKPSLGKFPKETSKISNYIKKLLNEEFTGGIDPRKAIFDINVAINNATDNYEVDLNDIPKLFSTNMFVLANKLIPLIGPELQKTYEDEKRRENIYKNPENKKNENN